MKMMYGGVPVESIKVKHYETSTNDCDMIASDLQAGKTAVARGKKIVGTGKAFAFATYGKMTANIPFPIPTDINVVEIASLEYPILMNIELREMYAVDFTSEPLVGRAVIDGVSHDIKISSNNNLLNIICDEDIELQIFYGKDEYV